jgi:hypothetical protein
VSELFQHENVKVEGNKRQQFEEEKVTKLFIDQLEKCESTRVPGILLILAFLFFP